MYNPSKNDPEKIVGYRIECRGCGYGLFSCGCKHGDKAEEWVNIATGRHNGTGYSGNPVYRHCFVSLITVEFACSEILAAMRTRNDTWRLVQIRGRGWVVDSLQAIYRPEFVARKDISHRIKTPTQYETVK